MGVAAMGRLQAMQAAEAQCIGSLAAAAHVHHAADDLMLSVQPHTSKDASCGRLQGSRAGSGPVMLFLRRLLWQG